MLAVPSALEVVSIALFLLVGLPAAAVTWRYARPRLEAALPASPARRRAAAVLALALAAGVATAPSTAWRIVEDVRYTATLPEHTAERMGAAENFVDGTIFDEVARRIPPRDSYYVFASPQVEPERARAAFEAWALTALLPRRAVARPERARWVVTWGVPPAELGVPVRQVEVVGRGGGGYPPAYVARVGA